MKTSATNKKIRELMTDLARGALVPNPDFQRRLVWTAAHKQMFIKTVLEVYPFPEIFLCDGDTDLDTGEGTQLVVDGQQRITTLRQYFTGDKDLELGDLQPYRDLDNPEKQAFLDYSVVVRDLGSLTDQQVRDVFYRMNITNYGLNAMEVNNARFDGQLKRVAEEIAAWSFFEDHPVFNALDFRRMGDVRWVLTVIITVMSGYFTRDTAHEEYLRRFNDEFQQGDAIKARLRAALDLIERLEFEPKSRAYRKTDLLTLLVEVYRLDPTLVKDEESLGGALRSFYAAVDAVGEGVQPAEWQSEAERYHEAVFSGNNERSRRIRRGEAIQAVIAPHFRALKEAVAPQ